MGFVVQWDYSVKAAHKVHDTVNSEWFWTQAKCLFIDERPSATLLDNHLICSLTYTPLATGSDGHVNDIYFRPVARLVLSSNLYSLVNRCVGLLARSFPANEALLHKQTTEDTLSKVGGRGTRERKGMAGRCHWDQTTGPCSRSATEVGFDLSEARGRAGVMCYRNSSDNLKRTTRC